MGRLQLNCKPADGPATILPTSPVQLQVDPRWAEQLDRLNLLHWAGFLKYHFWPNSEH